MTTASHAEHTGHRRPFDGSVPPIRFLNRADARQWMRTHHTEYLHDTLVNTANRRARNYTTTRDFLARAPLEWHPSWQSALTACVTDCVAQLWTWRRWLGTTWTFIAVDGTVVDDGMPHTIHDAIVLPEWLITKFLDGPPPKDAIETLLHEKVHTLQKNSQTAPFFEALYRAWGWQPLDSETVPQMVRAMHRTNPDTPRWWTIAPHNNRTPTRWLPCVRLVPNATSIRDVDYFFVRRVRGRELRWTPMVGTNGDGNGNGDRGGGDSGEDEIDTEMRTWYAKYYGHRPFCYHPDECAAVILAEWWIQEYAGKNSRQPRGVDPASRELINTLLP